MLAGWGKCLICGEGSCYPLVWCGQACRRRGRCTADGPNFSVGVTYSFKAGLRLYLMTTNASVSTSGLLHACDPALLVSLYSFRCIAVVSVSTALKGQ